MTRVRIGTASGRVTRTGAVPVYLDPIDLTNEDGNMSFDEAEVLVGDGMAEVVVSHEMADKDFGNGSSSFCSVKLTVNQDTASISAGAELASALALKLLPRFRAAATAVWDREHTQENASPGARDRRGREEEDRRGRGRQ